VSRVELDPERGRAVAVELKELGVKGVLITAPEQDQESPRGGDPPP
jgi:hypothetical protein